MEDITSPVSGVRALAARFTAAPGEGDSYHTWGAHWGETEVGPWEPSSSAAPAGAPRELSGGRPAWEKAPTGVTGFGSPSRQAVAWGPTPSRPHPAASEKGTPKAGRGGLCPTAPPAQKPPGCCEGPRPTVEPHRGAALWKAPSPLPASVGRRPEGLREPGGGRVAALTPAGRSGRPGPGSGGPPSRRAPQPFAAPAQPNSEWGGGPIARSWHL